MILKIRNILIWALIFYTSSKDCFIWLENAEMSWILSYHVLHVFVKTENHLAFTIYFFYLQWAILVPSISLAGTM